MFLLLVIAFLSSTLDGQYTSERTKLKAIYNHCAEAAHTYTGLANVNSGCLANMGAYFKTTSVEDRVPECKGRNGSWMTNPDDDVCRKAAIKHMKNENDWCNTNCVITGKKFGCLESCGGIIISKYPAFWYGTSGSFSDKYNKCNDQCQDDLDSVLNCHGGCAGNLVGQAYQPVVSKSTSCTATMFGKYISGRYGYSVGIPAIGVLAPKNGNILFYARDAPYWKMVQVDSTQVYQGERYTTRNVNAGNAEKIYWDSSTETPPRKSYQIKDINCPSLMANPSRKTMLAEKDACYDTCKKTVAKGGMDTCKGSCVAWLFGKYPLFFYGLKDLNNNDGAEEKLRETRLERLVGLLQEML